MSPIKLILFDLDDTLLHFDEYWEDSAKEAFQTHESTKDLDALLLFAVYKEKDGLFESQYHNQEITIEEYRTYRYLHTLSEFGRSLDEGIARDFEDHYKRVSKQKMKANEEVITLMKELSARYSIGIVTNGTASWQWDKLEAIRLHEVIPREFVFVSELVGVEKPNPQIYHHAIKGFKVRPEEVLFVGDSWRNDVEGPMSQGMQAIWFNRKNKAVPEWPNLRLLFRIWWNFGIICWERQ